MNEDQRNALQASIEHWRENVERHARGEELEIGAVYCDCCEYSSDLAIEFDGDFCDACPIAQYTGEDDCNKTPYYAVIRGAVPPVEMLDWLVVLEDGSEPPLLFNKPYAF
jgi:hypothetical protein